MDGTEFKIHCITKAKLVAVPSGREEGCCPGQIVYRTENGQALLTKLE